MVQQILQGGCVHILELRPSIQRFYNTDQIKISHRISFLEFYFAFIHFLFLYQVSYIALKRVWVFIFYMSSAKITTWIANSLFIFFIENYLSISWKYCSTLDTSIFGIKMHVFNLKYLL